MGGKTVMTFAQHCDLIDKIVIADIAPKAYEPQHLDLLKAMENIPLEGIKSRGEVDELLQKDIPNDAVRQFLLKNLYWKEKGLLAWKINLQTIKDNMQVIAGEIEQEIVDTPTLFIKGERSPYIMESDYEAIYQQFPNSRIEVIPKVGHWLHAENPEMFYQIVMDFFKE
jgi:pimeloyl-ACP methyl ester carboxylesterase